MSERIQGTADAVGAGANKSRSIRALCSLLDEEKRFLAQLNDDEYTDRPDPMTSSIASHIRHTLDHVSALLQGIARGSIDYDDRARDTEIERSRSAALDAIRSLTDDLTRISPTLRDTPIRVRGLVCADEPQITAESSAGRELLYVLSHTVHHHAMIASIGRSLGVAIPESFGYAPSTLAHLREA